MNKVNLVGVVVAAAMLLPALASAATINSVQFSNGDTTISCTGGSTVQATFQITIPQNEVVENVRTTVGGQPFVDTSVGGTLGSQEGVQSIQADVKCPPNTGYYNLAIQTAGIYGGVRSVSGADGVNGSASYNNAIRVTAGANGSTVGGDNQPPNWFQAWLASWMTSHPTPTPVPATSAKCVTLSAKMTGAQYGVTSPANGMLQGFLIGEGFSIPLLQANQAPFGFWGVQTQAAVSAYKTANSCN